MCTEICRFRTLRLRIMSVYNCVCAIVEGVGHLYLCIDTVCRGKLQEKPFLMIRAHSFPRAVEFRAEPWNFALCRRILTFPWNLRNDR